MHSWRAGYINELLLLLYRRKLMLFGIASLILPVILAVSLNALRPILGLVAVSASFPVQMLSFYTAIWIPLFILTATADLFPTEVAARTLKLPLLRPNTRFQVFGTKAAALGSAVGVLLLLLGIVSFICNLFAGEPAGPGEAGNILKAYAAAFVSMLALCALFTFVAQFFKSAAGFVVFSVVLYAVAQAAPFLIGKLSMLTPVAYTGWHMLWLGATVSAGRLWSGFFFLVSSTVLFFSLGYFTFERKEV